MEKREHTNPCLLLKRLHMFVLECPSVNTVNGNIFFFNLYLFMVSYKKNKYLQHTSNTQDT